MSEIELKGDAVLDVGRWFASKKINAPMVGSYLTRVRVYGLDHREWFITPDTARSMASALNYYANKADEWDGM